MFEFSGV